MCRIFVIFAENNPMKRALLFLLLALTVPFSRAGAQTVALGEKVPELRVSEWIGGQQPKPAQLTWIEFFHAQNPSSVTSLERLKALSSKLGTKLRIIVLSREKGEETLRVLTPYVSPRIGVGIDPSGRTFAAFGVQYVPFGVLTDARNRALWLGNSLQLKEETIRDNLH